MLTYGAFISGCDSVSCTCVVLLSAIPKLHRGIRVIWPKGPFKRYVTPLGERGKASVKKCKKS